jgi:hypothetical protein
MCSKKQIFGSGYIASYIHKLIRVYQKCKFFVHRLLLRSYCRVAYMRYYKKRKCLEEDNCNNEHERTKLKGSTAREFVYNEND